MQHLTRAYRHRGLSTIATIVTLIVTSILLIGAIRQRMEASTVHAGTAAGHALFEINKALGAYVTNPSNVEPIRTHGKLAGVVDVSSPTLAELQKLGYLSGTMDSTPANGGSYMIAIDLLPADCAPMDCNIASRLWLSNPVVETGGALDIKRLGAMMDALEGNGGFSDAESSGTIHGRGWTRNNPDAATRPGIVLAINGYDSTINSNYLRVRDDRDPEFQKELSARGDIVSKNFLGVGGLPLAAGSSCTDAQRGFLGKTDNGILLVCNGAVWENSSGIDQVVSVETKCNAGEVRSDRNGVLLSCQAGFFRDAAGFPRNVVEGSVCRSAGSFGMDEVGRSYMCRGERWLAQASLNPHEVQMSRQVVTDQGPVVEKPTCAAGGIAKYVMTPVSVSLDLTTAPPYSAVEYFAEDEGANWDPVIWLKDPRGNHRSGDEYGISALMLVYCMYPN